jgi:DNA-binding cell septation regulator SpoVG
VPIPLEIIMKLATAINTLQQDFGLTNVEVYKGNEGQFKPYEFYMLTDKFYIQVIHPMNDRRHTNYIQNVKHFLPINVDEILNLKRIFVRITPNLSKNMAWDEYQVSSLFAINRGDTDFIKNLLSQIA